MPKIYKGKCKTCGKFYKGRGQLFCSRSCQRIYLNKINNPAKNPEVKKKIALSRIGKSTGSNEKHWNWKGKKYQKAHCQKCGVELKTNLQGRKIIPKYCKNCMNIGERSPMWKGGITIQRIKEYKTPQYLNFIKSILKRDNYTCQKCNATNGNGTTIKLEVHHIKSYAEYPKLRFDINNAITLCRECHHNTKRNNKRPSRIDFIQNNPKSCVICEKPINIKNPRKYCPDCRNKFCCPICKSINCRHKARKLLYEATIT